MTTETPEEIIKRCMPHVTYEHVDGVLYQKWNGDFIPTVAYKKLSELKLNPEDVYSNGWLRSANHWTYYVLDMVLKQSATPTTVSFPDSIPEVMSQDQLDAFKAAPSPRLFCGHPKPKRYPDIARKNTHIVYVIRNPKDAMVSFYRLVSDFAKEHQFNGTWDEYFEAMMAGALVFGSWFDHVLEFEKYMAANPDVPVYIHQFEEMRHNPVECVKKLCAFLGKPDTLVEDIVASSDIDSIKAVIKDQTENNDKFFKGQEPTFIRKGDIGYWKKHFTVAQNERFNEQFEKRMKDSKLAQLVRPYI